MVLLIHYGSKLVADNYIEVADHVWTCLVANHCYLFRKFVETMKGPG